MMNKKDRYWITKYNEWRYMYEQMSYQDMQDFYSGVANAYPEQKSWLDRDVIPFFTMALDDMEHLSVLELGGWRGSLADRIFNLSIHIERWSNYEVCSSLKDKQLCRSLLYSFYSEDYLWNSNVGDRYNVFVASHVIEHLNRRHLLDLMDKLDELKSLKYIFIASPLPLDKGKKWESYRGAHKLDMGWYEVYLLLRSYGWKDIRYEPGAGIYTGMRE